MVQPLLGSHRNGQDKLYLFRKYLLCWEHEYIVSHNKIHPVKVTFCVLFYNLFLLNCQHCTSLHSFKETAQSCEFYDNARCFFPSHHLASSTLCCQGSSYLTRTIRLHLFLSLLLRGFEWVPSKLTRYPWVKNSQYLLTIRLGGPLRWYGCPCQKFNHRSSNPQSSYYTD